MRRLMIVLTTLTLAACAAEAPDPGIRERYSGTATADAALRQRVLLDTATYWAAIAAGDWQAAYDRYTLDYQERVPFGEWRLMRHDDWATKPRVLSIHWTEDAQRQHGPELYAIVEWTARADRAGSGGTLVWRRDDGVFHLENSIVRP